MASGPDSEEAEGCAVEVLELKAREEALELLLRRGLYQSIDLSTELGKAVEQRLLKASSDSFDAYCDRCKRESPFRIAAHNVSATPIGTRYRQEIVTPALFAVYATCQRDFRVYSYVFIRGDQKLTKIGQNPSLAVIAHGELRSLDGSLNEVDRLELGKALGLFAHDTALGAFVYLRRVFERMIDRAHNRMKAGGHELDGFANMPMDRRIASLSNELPDKVVRNSGLFAILSLGIHELTEERCASLFPLMKATLFQMLEREAHMRRSISADRETDAALHRVLSSAKKGK